MLETEQPKQRAATATKHTERIAWLVLLTGFAAFSLISATIGNLLYQRWSQPPIGEIGVLVDQPLAVQVQRAGLIKKEVLPSGEHLNPGDRVFVSNEATPGAATTLRFGSASIELWAGTDLKLGQFGQQWNDPAAATARLTLNQGQIMIELARADQTIEIETALSSTPVVLSSPGRYRVRILAPDSPTTALAERPAAPQLEVATERGSARVGKVTINPGQRLVDAPDGQRPGLLRWDLIRDGSFLQTVNWGLPQVANRPDAPPPWKFNVKSTAEGAANTGQVRPTQECDNPLTRVDCEQPYVRLVRKGGNTKGFSTAIAQKVDADVSSYQHIRLRADVRVVMQSLSKAGQSGTECPMLIRVIYSNHQATSIQKDYCFWAFDHGNDGVVADQPYIESQQLAPDTWYTFDRDLRLELDGLVKIEEISFQANGHDYESQVRDVHLTGEGLAEIAAP